MNARQKVGLFASIVAILIMMTAGLVTCADGNSEIKRLENPAQSSLGTPWSAEPASRPSTFPAPYRPESGGPAPAAQPASGAGPDHDAASAPTMKPKGHCAPAVPGVGGGSAG